MKKEEITTGEEEGKFNVDGDLFENESVNSDEDPDDEQDDEEEEESYSEWEINNSKKKTDNKSGSKPVSSTSQLYRSSLTSMPKITKAKSQKHSKTETKLPVLGPSEWNVDDNRYMKSDDQVKILESEFQKDTKWSKEKMRRLANLLNLKESQIYKWNWDRRQMQDRYLQKRILGGDLPENLFRVTKVDKNENADDI